jgi:GMP synthase (glutamine-hydrolysing)
MGPVLLVGHDSYETFGLVPAVLEATGLEVRRHDSSRLGPPSTDPSGLGGLVVFGGVMNVDQTERFPFLRAERELVRRALERGIPFLGICLGAQMLARALEVPVYRAPVREIGFSVLHPTEAAAGDPLVSVFRDGDMVFHWHEDTFHLPDGAVLLGTGDEVEVQAFRVGDRAWGLQFHLEIDRAELELWIDVAGAEGIAAWGSTPERLRAQADRHLPLQEERSRELFRRYAALVRGDPPG